MWISFDSENSGFAFLIWRLLCFSLTKGKRTPVPRQPGAFPCTVYIRMGCGSSKAVAVAVASAAQSAPIECEVEVEVHNAAKPSAGPDQLHSTSNTNASTTDDPEPAKSADGGDRGSSDHCLTARSTMREPTAWPTETPIVASAVLPDATDTAGTKKHAGTEDLQSPSVPPQCPSPTSAAVSPKIRRLQMQLRMVPSPNPGQLTRHSVPAKSCLLRTFEFVGSLNLLRIFLVPNFFFPGTRHPVSPTIRRKQEETGMLQRATVQIFDPFLAMRGPGRPVDIENSDETPVLPANWRAAADPEGRTYYYHYKTKRVSEGCCCTSCRCCAYCTITSSSFSDSKFTRPPGTGRGPVLMLVSPFQMQAKADKLITTRLWRTQLYSHR